MPYGLDNQDQSKRARPRTTHHKRARELFRYVQPEDLILPQFRPTNTTPSTSHSGSKLATALSPFAQLAGICCNARTCLINVMDGDTMYFLAEATQTHSMSRRPSRLNPELTQGTILLNCSGVPLHNRVCELTLGIDPKASASYQFFVIEDFREDSRFADMPIVQGTPYYRFYAGTPLITETGINIGSLAIMDTRPRPPLTAQEEACLGQTAEHIVSYLEINRRALEGTQGKLMADALNHFADGASSLSDATGPEGLPKSTSRSKYGIPLQGSTHDSLRKASLRLSDRIDRVYATKAMLPSDTPSDPHMSKDTIPPTLSKVCGHKGKRSEALAHDATFARAANLLRESLQLTGADGVLFVGMGTGLLWAPDNPLHVSLDPLRAASLGGNEPLAPVRAYSTSEASSTTSSTPASHNAPDVNERAVLELSRRYPRGCMWVLDENGNLQTPSADGLDEAHRDLVAPPDVPADSASESDAEQNFLSSTFATARQVLFSPLWDASLARFSSACFVWTSSETRILDARTELGFLNTFGRTITTECSRLDTELSDRQKSDFIGSISHELRSPLHGILGSVEFLSERPLEAFEKSLVENISSCSKTLLDTINSVLDYSKINSFELDRTGRRRQKAREGDDASISRRSQTTSGCNVAPLLRLSGPTNIASLAEEVVDGVTLGFLHDSGSLSLAGATTNAASYLEAKSVRPEVILDVAYEDWIFYTQPGAIRRIIMNLVGNAIKYTSKGYVKIELDLANTAQHLDRQDAEPEERTIRLTISDTGRGISAEYLTNDLFVPFSQEDPIAPGTGLGLSIVRSIVSMLNGSIDISSRLGVETVVRVLIPLERPDPDDTTSPRQVVDYRPSGTDTMGENLVQMLRSKGAAHSIAIYSSSNDHERRDSAFKSAVRKTLLDWYQMHLLPEEGAEQADIVLLEETNFELFHTAMRANNCFTSQALLIMCNDTSGQAQARSAANLRTRSDVVEFISKPCGAYKVGKALGRCIERLDAQKHFASLRSGQTALRVYSPKPVLPNTCQKTGRHLLDDFAAPQASHLLQMQPAPAPEPEPHTVSNVPAKHRPLVGRAFTTPNTRLKSKPPPSTPLLRHPSDTSMMESDISPHILLVDDNKVNLRLLQTYCKQRRYRRVTSAENGQVAVDAVRMAQMPIDIILMDISMPVKNGFEATREIRAMEAKEPMRTRALIIMLTGLASGRDQAEGVAAGCDTYLTKPVSFQEVGRVIEGWKTERRGLNEG